MRSTCSAQRARWSGVRTTIPPGLSSACAAVAGGAAAGLALRATREAWAGSPSVLAWSVVGPATILFLVPRLRPRSAWIVAALGAVGACAWPTWGRALGALVALPAAALAVAIVVPLAAGALVAPVAHVARRAHPLAWCAAPLGLLAGGALPPVGGAALTLALVALATRVDPPLRAPAPVRFAGTHPDPRRRGLHAALACLGAAMATVVLLSSWSLLRPALGPAPADAVLALAGVAAAALAPPGRLTALAGLVACGAAAALTQAATPSLGAVVGLGGLGLGMVLRGVSSAPAVVLGLGLACATYPRVLAALPTEVVERATAAGVGLYGDADYRETLVRSRAENPPVLASLGHAGAARVWRAGTRVVAEIDGTLAGASTRARAAETMAGVLAGCASPARGRVLVLGDELGLVAMAAREQGFAGLDVAVGSGAVVSAVAELDRDARRAWLAAETRLVRLPGPALLHLGGPASAVVVVQRAAWTDATSMLPSRTMLAAARARAPEGAVVVVVPALGVPPEVLGAVLSTFASVFPNASLWLPPQGGEQALLVGSSAPLAWAGVERCFAQSRGWLTTHGVADPVDLAGLAVAGTAWLRALTTDEPPAFARAAAAASAKAIALGQLGLDDAGPVDTWAGAAPTEEIEARRQARRAALAVLDASASGSMAEAITRARALADTPGAQAALEPLVAPLLDRARAAAAQAQREGASSSRWGDAEGAVMAALLVHPGSAEAQCTRAEIAFARRQLDVSLEAFTACVERAPERVAGWEGLARARRLSGDLEGTEAALRKALSLAPNRLQPPLHLGILLTDLEQPDEAERWLRRAADLAQSGDAADKGRAHLALARLYVKTGRSRPALAEARRAEVESPSADSAYWTGAAQYQLGAASEAEASFRLALARDANHTGALNDLGMCLADRGAYPEAVDAFRRVLALDPTSSGASKNLERLRPYVAGDGAP